MRIIFFMFVFFLILNGLLLDLLVKKLELLIDLREKYFYIRYICNILLLNNENFLCFFILVGVE